MSRPERPLPGLCGPEDGNGTRLVRLRCWHLFSVAFAERLCRTPCAWPGLAAPFREHLDPKSPLDLLPQRLTRHPVLLLERHRHYNSA